MESRVVSMVAEFDAASQRFHDVTLIFPVGLERRKHFHEKNVVFVFLSYIKIFGFADGMHD